MKEHTKIKIGIVALALIFSAFMILILLPQAIAPNIVGSNYRNVTVNTRLNITHSKPDMLNVTVYDAVLNSSIQNITVVAGSTKQVYCNGTVRNWNGFNDITAVRGVLWHNVTSTYNAANDTNNHYSNNTCWLNVSFTAYTGYFICSFDLQYYANNGTWICNMTVENTYTANNSNYTGAALNYTTLSPVYALNVTDGIDYGGVAVEDYSAPDRTANITNLGNRPINVTVEGYGVNRTDGLAMICNVQGNITVDNERFSTVAATPYASKTSLVSTLGGVGISGLTIQKQNDSVNLSTNITYWQIYVPPNPSGNCTGFIIFTAGGQ